MKKILSLSLLFLTMALALNAQTVEWKAITKSMTTVPSDYCETATRDDAVAFAQTEFMAEVVAYGPRPTEGGQFSVIYYDFDEGWTDTTMSWDDMVDNGCAYYPALASGGGDSQPKEIVIETNTDESITTLYTVGKTYDKVTVKRNFQRFLADGTTKMWHPVALPFAMSADDITACFGSGASVAQLTGFNGDVAEYQTVSTIDEETLYLVQLGDLADDITQIDLADVTMSSIYGKYDVSYTGMPTYENTTIDNFVSACYIVDGNKAVYVDDEAELPATAYYFASDGYDVADLQIEIDGVSTAINTIAFPSAPTVRKYIRNNNVIITDGSNSYNTVGQKY